MQVIKDNGVEIIPEPKPASYWMRNKKPALDFLQDTPFAADRQLEDQRYLSELNRNPRLNDITKMDKLRSVQIAQTKGLSRSVAIKANVINKVVREASGVHNYTIVPPPRMDDVKSVTGKEKLEPETNPLVRAYAQEAKSKPVVCSFGHRPKSASRTFHPATMKFRLKHGQILPSVKDGKTGVGLPVAVLKKVLHAPKIYHDIAEMIDIEPSESMDNATTEEGQRMNHTSSAPGIMQSSPSRTNLRNELFLPKDQQDDLFYPNRSGKRPNGRLAPLDTDSKGSWISSIEQQQRRKKEPPKPERPEWNEGFHRITIKASDRFDQKKSLLNPKSDKPLSELLHRFDSLTVAENQPTIFCPEKQELDKVERSGQPVPVPKSIPVKGRSLYSDPWDIQVQQIKMMRKLDEEEKKEKNVAKAFQEKLRTIPKVKYYPTSALKRFHNQQLPQPSTTSTFSHSQSLDQLDQQLLDATESSLPNKPTSTMETLKEKYPYWAQTEDEMHLALLLAKRGDRRALYDFHLAGANRDSSSRALPSAWRSEHPANSTGLSDFPEWSASVQSPLSDSLLLSGSYPHMQEYTERDEEQEDGEESTFVHRISSRNTGIGAAENEEEGGDGDDGRATVTFSDLEQQRQQLQEDAIHEQLLEENTIE